MTRNTISNLLGSVGLLAVLFSGAAIFHYDQLVLGFSLFVGGAALITFAPSTPALTKPTA